MKRSFFIYPAISLCILAVFFIKRDSFSREKHILKISQLSLQKEALSSLYLTELLGLCYDKKVSREEFDLSYAKKKLLASALIDDVFLSFPADDHIQVTYWHASPIALLADFQNQGIDKHGKIFPIKPFLSPKGLPNIFLGIKKIQSGKSMENYKEKSRWEFAQKVLGQLRNMNIEGSIDSIDVSKIEERSLGKNELILTFKYLQRNDVLRLSKRNYLNEVSNYIILCDKLKNETGTLMIDFRFDAAAFIEKFDCR